MAFFIHWHESVMGAHVSSILTPPPPPPVPSFRVVPVYQLWLFSCIKLGLVMYFTYGNIDVSMLFSQIIPPSSSPTESKSPFLILCLFCCLEYRVIVTIFLNYIYIYVNILYWCFSFCLTSLCIMGSSFIHLIRTDSNAFFLMAE